MRQLAGGVQEQKKREVLVKLGEEYFVEQKAPWEAWKS
jgi:hypothetical protein